jgi:hypothetical protein
LIVVNKRNIYKQEYFPINTMKENIPRLARTDDHDWDCLLFRNEAGDLDFRLSSAAEHVLYDGKGMPVYVLPLPSTLGLDQIAAGYQRASHKVADAVRKFLNPMSEYPISEGSTQYVGPAVKYV